MVATRDSTATLSAAREGLAAGTISSGLSAAGTAGTGSEAAAPRHSLPFTWQLPAPPPDRGGRPGAGTEILPPSTVPGPRSPALGAGGGTRTRWETPKPGAPRALTRSTDAGAHAGLCRLEVRLLVTRCGCRAWDPAWAGAGQRGHEGRAEAAATGGSDARLRCGAPPQCEESRVWRLPVLMETFTKLKCSLLGLSGAGSQCRNPTRHGTLPPHLSDHSALKPEGFCSGL